MWLFVGLCAVIILGITAVILSGVGSAKRPSEADMIAKDIEIIEV